MPNDRLFATDIPLGLETLEMVQSARAASSRVIVYSEASLPVEDARMLCVASGAVASSEGDRRERTVDGPRARSSSAAMTTPTTTSRWTAGVRRSTSDGEVAIPAGEHEVRLGRAVLSRAVKTVPRLCTCSTPLSPCSREPARGSAGIRV